MGWLIQAVGGVALLTAFVAAGLGGCGEATESSTPGAGGTAYPGDPCEPEGAVDDCYPGSPTTRGVGECRLGSSECLDRRWGDCIGYQLPAEEICNGLDDDCNGATDDGCSAGGAGGAAGAGGSSGGSGGAPSGLRLYRRDFTSSASSFTAESATDVWSGGNAPDPESVVAVESSYGSTEPWLFVVSTAGLLHVRQGQTWLTPRSFAATFAGLDVGAVNALVIWQPAAGDPQSFQFSARSGGTEKFAYDYTVALPSFDVTPSPNNPIEVQDDPDPAAPPHYMVDLDWGFAHQTAYSGTEHWVLFYMQCGANAYLFDGGNFAWADLGLAEQSNVWGANPSLGPAAGTTRAAWLEGNELYLLAP